MNAGHSHPFRSALAALIALSMLACGPLGGITRRSGPDVPTRFARGVRSRKELTGQELATRLRAAGDLDGVTAVLRDLYAGLGVGLYTPDGWQIQPGAETGPADYYQYTLLSDRLAQAFLEGARASVEDEARFLAAAGVILIDSGQAISGSDLLAMLSAAAAASRQDSSLLSPGLIDGLARSEGVDLASADLEPSTTYLDPIQEFVVSYDVLMGLPSKSSSTGKPGLAAAARKEGGPCNFKGAEEIGEGVEATERIGGVIADLAEGAGRTGKGISRAFTVLGAALTFADLITDQAVMKGYKVDVRPEPPKTHWRHTPGIYENEVKITATITFDLPEGREIARCGRLSGYDFPDNGPVGAKFVSARWTFDGVLLRNGQYGLVAGLDQRDPNGEGKVGMRFTPHREANPGDGIEVRETGKVDVCISLIGRGFGLGVNALNQFGYVPCGSANLEVARHTAVSLSIGGSLSSPSGMTIKVATTTIPLTAADGKLTGSGAVINALDVQGLPSGCTFKSSIPVQLTIEATGTETLNFTLNGLSSMNTSISCFGVSMDKSFPPMGGGQPLNFSLPAKIGEVYHFTPAGFSGSIDLTLEATK